MIKFDSDVGSFSTFDEVGTSLIKMMGHSGTIPSAIAAADVENALATLRSKIGALPEADQPGATHPDDDDDDNPKVPMGRRAFALVTLLEDAHRQNSGIRWAHR